MRNNPGIAQTNLLCCAKSAFFAPRSNLKETQTFLTFAWSLQASRLFARAKGAACRSWLQVCVCEFREARRRSSLIPRHSVRYTLCECKPGTTRSYLRWQKPEDGANPHFAHNIHIRKCTLCTYVVFSLALLPFMLSAMKLPSTHMVFNIQLLYMHLHCSQPVSISLTM